MYNFYVSMIIAILILVSIDNFLYILDLSSFSCISYQSWNLLINFFSYYQILLY